MEDLIVFVLVLFVLAGGATVGRMVDPQFRCSLMRRFLKKNYVVVNFGDKKGRTIFQSVVNADDGVIIMGSRMWVVKGGRIFNAVQKEGKISIDKDGGYTFKDDDMKYTPGTPNIFLSPDTLTPLDFYGPEALVKPDEIGSTILAWVSTQINKGLNKFASLDLWIKATMVGVVLILLVQYFVLQEFDKAHKERMDQNAAISALDKKIMRLGYALHINLDDQNFTQIQEQQGGTIIVNGKPTGG